MYTDTPHFHYQPRCRRHHHLPLKSSPNHLHLLHSQQTQHRYPPLHHHFEHHLDHHYCHDYHSSHHQ